MAVRIGVDVLSEITDVKQERNIYVHPNSLARDIFWRRLERIYTLLKRYCAPEDKVLDFGGGSGAFSKALCQYFQSVDAVDLEPQDAFNIKKHFNLENLHIFKEDIETFKKEHKYDAIIAADVLEHFSDLSMPLNSITKNLIREGGLLFVSLPTENFLYLLGRVLVGKTKPLDHYHSSRQVINYIKQCGFVEVTRTFEPRYLIPVPLFEIGVFRYQPKSVS